MVTVGANMVDPVSCLPKFAALSIGDFPPNPNMNQAPGCRTMLMEEIRHVRNPVNNGIFTISTGAGFFSINSMSLKSLK